MMEKKTQILLQCALEVTAGEPWV